MTPAQEAAKIAAKYVTKMPVRCRVCLGAKENPRAMAIALLLRNVHGKSFPLIAQYLLDQGVKVTKSALNAHFYAGHMGHKDQHENRPGPRA